VPTGYAELLFGVWKGFDELRRLGLIAAVPRMVACEPAARGPLARAVAAQLPLARVDPGPTRAVAIACTVSSFRGIAAINSSNGLALVVSDEEVAEAKAASGAAGLWPEFSSAAALAAVRKAKAAGERFDGPIVAIQTSAGFKDPFVASDAVPRISPSWEALTVALRDLYGISVAEPPR
jgi:threonine synthase